VPSTRADGVVTPEELFRFVDFLRESGQKLWQLLPLNPAEKEISRFTAPRSLPLTED
jgi:4-alpha-glucanotransferase